MGCIVRPKQLAATARRAKAQPVQAELTHLLVRLDLDLREARDAARQDAREGQDDRHGDLLVHEFLREGGERAVGFAVVDPAGAPAASATAPRLGLGPLHAPQDVEPVLLHPLGVDGERGCKGGDLQDVVEHHGGGDVVGEHLQRRQRRVAADEEREEVGEARDGDGGARLGERLAQPRLDGERRVLEVELRDDHEHVVHPDPQQEEGGHRHERAVEEPAVAADPHRHRERAADAEDAGHRQAQAQAVAARPGPPRHHDDCVDDDEHDGPVEHLQVALDRAPELVPERP